MFKQDTIPPPAPNFSIRQYLEQHPFFAGLPAPLLSVVVPAAEEINVEAQCKVFRQETAADHFYVVLDGQVAVEVPAVAGEPAQLQTLGPGKLLGWSWLIPPHRWHFDARALQPTRLLRLDGQRLREWCRANPELGYPLLEREASLMMERLREARLRVMEAHVG